MLDDRPKRLLAAAALAFTVLWFGLLVGRPLYDPDEGRYAEIPREMLAGGDWVIPHLDGFNYLEKPPLQYWATALLFAGLGEAEWSARLYTGVTGYLSLLLVFAIGKRLWGPNSGLKALLLAAGSILFILLGHQLTLDMALSFWLLASLASFIFAQSDRTPRRCRAWMLACWASMAFAVLSKGLIGVVIPGFSLVAYVLWQRDWRLLRQLNFRFGVPLFAALALPWFVLAARANAEFLQFFFIREHFQRFLTPIEARSQPWWFFVPVLIVGVLPWITRAVRALASDWRASVPVGQFDARRLLWIWSAFVLVFFSLSDSKLIPYILPCVPTLAVLSAAPAQQDEERGHLIAGAALSVLFALGSFVYASAIWSSADGRALAVELRPAVFLVGLALIAGAALSLMLAAQRRTLSAWAALSVGWLAAATAITVGASEVQRYFSAKDVAAVLRREASADVPLFSVQTYQQSLPFYLGRVLVLVDYRDEFALGLRQDPARAIGSIEEFERRWTALRAGFAIMPASTRERLQAAGLSMRPVAQFADRNVLVSRQ